MKQVEPRHPRMTAPGLLALVLLLPACSTQNPDGSDGFGQAIVQENPPWQSTWELVRADLDRERVPSVTKILHRGQYLSVAAIRVGGTLPPPTRHAAEVLIVIEGTGTLVTRGAQHLISAGTIAVLPAGQRGAIHAPEGGFYAILIRSQIDGAGEGKVTVTGIEEAFPSSLIDNSGGNHAHTIGSAPGQLTVRTRSISGTIERHVHLAHDEFVFLIRGWGSMGLGSEGSARNFIRPYPMRERSLVLIPAHSPHSYANEFDQTLVITVYGPSMQAGDADFDPIE